MDTIHTRIKQRREELGMSMKELAEKVGVSAWQTVQQWEKEGGTAPKRSRLQAVADALQTFPEFLTYGPGHQLDFSLSMKGLLTELENAAKNSQAPARAGLSDEAVKVGAAFDRIESKAHRDLVIAALRAFGGWMDEDENKKN
ncbi:helix-turn-helix domain-containing protein [Massilia aquatica]|uniref:Helix-turn-helix transcriptional regulator n=1 Tax=Massilia aquatica TaxID=2609000 RepID=A0ABX0LYZ8_9BURK|nr:helix-turn-helix transcriptional regulator [Massilia aquatica]NHZ40093.1 helix-turn-helix transcriptional regulator [Massilia aquatica]